MIEGDTKKTLAQRARVFFCIFVEKNYFFVFFGPVKVSVMR